MTFCVFSGEAEKVGDERWCLRLMQENTKPLFLSKKI